MNPVAPSLYLPPLQPAYPLCSLFPLLDRPPALLPRPTPDHRYARPGGRLRNTSQPSTFPSLINAVIFSISDGPGEAEGNSARNYVLRVVGICALITSRTSVHQAIPQPPTRDVPAGPGHNCHPLSPTFPYVISVPYKIPTWKLFQSPK